MALTSGVRLGAYEIARTLGTGGMGEVYLAHDTKLGRQVARRRDGRARLRPLVDTRAGATFWAASPDGSTVAFGQFDWDRGDSITLLRIATGERRVIKPQHVKNLTDVAWAPDGRSLFATVFTIRASEVLHVGLDGTTRVLRAYDSQAVMNPRPSPDGRSLLIGLSQTNANAWIIDR